MHQSTGKKNKILAYLIFFVFLSTINHKSIENQKMFSITIESIDVMGLSDSKNLEIKEKLNKLLFTNIFSFNKNSIREVISNYNSVESYRVQKIYPKHIIIELEPVKLLAQIQNQNSYLIGSNGKLIIRKDINEKLPFFFGKFDSQKFLEFKKVIDKSKFRFSNFKSVFYYPSNRWDILTINDILIKLPENELSKTLKVAYQIINDDQFVNKKILDLRIPKHVVITNE